MDDDTGVEDLRVAVYRALAATGRVPSRGTLADTLGWSPDDVRSGLRSLHDARHVVLRPAADPRDRPADGGTGIVLAHPFATGPLGFSVMGERTLWWGGCAWDSFAIPHLVVAEPEVLVSTRCPACERPLAWVVGREAPPYGDEVAHFLVPVPHIWDDVVHTCGNQRLFCSEACVDDWLARTGNERGYVLDLPTLWRLAAHWYDGRLEHGYTRRDPSTAAAYFREVGLSGPFWGLGAQG
jgi:hypothetical protein